MNNKVILTDIDEVLLKWADEFQRYIIVDRNYEAKGNLVDIFWIADWLHIKETEAKELIYDFCHTPQFSDLKPYPDALRILPRLVSEGWRFVGITATSETETTKDLRKKNLENIFGPIFDDIHCVGLGTVDTKSKVLQTYEPAWWIEDSWNHAISGVEAGHQTFLINRPYNLHKGDHPDLTRVDGWDDIYKLINSGQ